MFSDLPCLVPLGPQCGVLLFCFVLLLKKKKKAFKNYTNEQKEQNANLVGLCGTAVGFAGLTPEGTLKDSLLSYFDVVALGLHEFCWEIRIKQALP